MTKRSFAGFVLALSLLAPAFGAPRKFEAGALQVETLGDHGPAVILIPGLSSGTWVWRYTAPRQATDTRVYLLSVPGFAGRPAHPGVTLASLQTALQKLIAN